MIKASPRRKNQQIMTYRFIMSIDIERQSQICTWVKNWIRTRLNRARCFEPSLRGLRDLQGATDCTSFKGALSLAMLPRQQMERGGWRLELRHGENVPARGKVRATKDFELQEKML